MENFGGGNWGMIPSIQSHSNPATPPNQDHLFLQHQQFNQQQYQQQQQQHQRFQQQQQQQPPPQPQPTQQQHQSLASHFHLIHLVENLVEVTENGTRDQQTDALVGELNTQFERCQQLLNSIAGTVKTKSTTVEEKKHRLEETENLLTQRRDLITRYRSLVEELISDQI